MEIGVAGSARAAIWNKVAALPIPHGPVFMSLRLWHRLFLAFAALSILAMATFALLQTRSFQNGFLDYVNRLEREKIESMAHSLESAYAANGSDWRFLRGDTRQLMHTLELPAPSTRSIEERGIDQRGLEDNDRSDGPQAQGEFARDDRNWRPPPRLGDGRRPPPDGEAHRPPPRFADDRRPGPPSDGRAQREDVRPPNDRTAPPRPLRPAHDLPPRLLLLDSAGGVVAGNPRVARNVESIAIRSQGQVVGRLLLAPLPRLRSDLDLEFAREQRQQMAVIALVVLLAALVLAWVLSRWLLRPMRELASATHALSAGDFTRRIAGRRSDELGALANDFNALAETLERHRDARRQWGADIAHELRTPIGVLIGEIQALQDGIRPVGPETLASLQAECARLHHLTEDLYQLSLSEAGALSYRFEQIDLSDVVNEAVQANSGAVRAAGLDLRWQAPSSPCTLQRGDKARLRQLLDNLLSNAVRYTDAPGHVRIDIMNHGDTCTLRMDDSAPGVPTSALPHLFERMYRVEPSRSRRYGGAGLGLAICRNIVEAHGGRIDASASPDGGLRIDIVLPTHSTHT